MSSIWPILNLNHSDTWGKNLFFQVMTKQEKETHIDHSLVRPRKEEPSIYHVFNSGNTVGSTQNTEVCTWNT